MGLPLRLILFLGLMVAFVGLAGATTEDTPDATDRWVTIAFLPPVNRTTNPDLAWLSLAVQDTATLRSWEIPGLSAATLTELAVTARTPPERLAPPTDEAAVALGRRLGVEYVVASELRSDGADKLKLSARLLRTSDGADLWAGELGAATRLTLLESIGNLVLQVSTALKLEVPDAAIARVRSPLTAQPQAAVYGAVGAALVAGLSLQDRHARVETASDALRLLRYAVAIDPSDAEAWDHLGWAYLELASIMGRWGEAAVWDHLAWKELGQDEGGLRDAAGMAFAAALRLKPELIDALAGYGLVKGANDTQGRRALESAIALNPALARHHRLRLRALLDGCQTTAALAALEEWRRLLERVGRAKEVSKWQADLYVWLGLTAWKAGRYQDAADHFREGMTLAATANQPALVHMGLLAAEAARVAGRPNSEGRFLRQTAEVASTIFGDTSRQRAAALVQLAHHEERLGHLEAAANAMSQALEAGALVERLPCSWAELDELWMASAFPAIHPRPLDFGDSTEYFDLPDTVLLGPQYDSLPLAPH